MAEWIVRLEGHEFDLLELANHVRAADLSVAKEADGFYLRAAAFQSCSEAQEVLDRANDLLPVLNGATAVYVRKYRPVSIAHVTRLDDDGRPHRYIFAAGSIEARSRVSVSVERANGAAADEGARALLRNPGSWRVMEKVGMVREGVLRSYVRKGDAFEDVVAYAVLRPEFEDSK